MNKKILLVILVFLLVVSLILANQVISPHAPANNTNYSFTDLNVSVPLNLSIRDTSGTPMCVEIYGDKSITPRTDSLLYKDCGLLATGSNITYNWTSPVINNLSVDTTGLVLLMHFDNRTGFGENASRVIDFSGNNNYGNVTMNDSANLAIYRHNNTGGKFAGAYDFDGDGDYIDIGNPTTLKPTTFTVAAWANPRRTEAGGGLGKMLDWNNDAFGYQLAYRDNAGAGTNNPFFFSIGNGTTTSSGTNVRSQPVLRNQWTFVVGTFDGTNMRLYINGSLVNTSGALPQPVNYTLATNFRIGTRGTDARYWNGSIDEVAIWNRVLSGPEIMNMYRLTNGTYYWSSNTSNSTNFSSSEIWRFGANGDFINPTTTLSMPTNDYFNDSYTPFSVNFQCNISDDRAVKNLSLYITNSANQSFAFYGGTIFNGTTNTTNWTISLATGNYTWNCLGYDSLDNYDWADTNRTVQINLTYVLPKWTQYPDNVTLEYRKQSVDVDFNATGTGAMNYSVNDTTSFWINDTNGTLTNKSLIAIGRYVVNVTVTDTASGTNRTTFNVTIQDTNAPAWSQYPNNITLEYGTKVDIDFNATDATAINYSINDTTSFWINDTNGTLFNLTVLPTGRYVVNISANDTSKNTNRTTFNVTIQDTTAPTSTLSMPANGYFNDTSVPSVILLQCNATDTYNLANISLYITNSTNKAFIFNATTALNGTSNTTNWTLSLDVGNYTWGCLANDSYGNGKWSSNRTMTINTSSQLAIDLITPSLTDINLSQNQTFNVTVNVTCFRKDCGVINVSLFVNLSNEFANYTLEQDAETAVGWEGPNCNGPLSATDENWGTSAFSWMQCSIYVNYTIPSGTTNATDIVSSLYDPGTGKVYYYCYNYSNGQNVLFGQNQVGQQITNNPLPTGCINGSILRLNFSLNGDIDPGSLYEDKIIWNMTTQERKYELVNTSAYPPVYTTGLNPINITLNKTQRQEVIFYLNASGQLNQSYSFFVSANLTDDYWRGNGTRTWNATINQSSDSDAPTVNLITPVNNSYNSSTTINFSASITDNMGAKNATLYVFNGTTNASLFENTTNFTGGTISVIWGWLYTLKDSIYKWFVGVFDWRGNYNQTENMTFTIDATNGQSSSIVFGTTGGTTDGSFIYGQYLDYINVTCSDTNLVGCNLTLIGPNEVILDNIGLSNQSSLFYYTNNIFLNVTGTWTVNITAYDKANNLNFSYRTFTVSVINQSLLTGFYGYNSKNIPDNATITDLAGYHYDLIEFEENATNFDKSWGLIINSTIDKAWDLNLRIGLTYYLNYNLSTNIQARDNFRANLTRYLPDLLVSPRVQTIGYIRFVVNNSAVYTESNLTTHNLNLIAKDAYDSTSNEFTIYSSYNSSSLETDYIINDGELIHLTSTSSAGLVDQLSNISRNATSKTRIYYNLTNTEKAIALNYQNDIMIPLFDYFNITTNAPYRFVSEISGGGFVVYNNQSTLQNLTFNLTNCTEVYNPDIWDFTNHILLANNTDGMITFINVPAYGFVLVGTNNLIHISLDSNSEGYVLASPQTRYLYTNYTDGTRDGASDFSVKRAVELWDDSYMGERIKVYYGWLNISHNPFVYDGLDILIIADNNSGEISKFFNGSATISKGIFGYVGVGDYGALPGSCNTSWVNEKKAEIDSWITQNANMDIFMDGWDIGAVNDQGCFFTDAKNVSDYVKVTKGRELGVNVFTNFTSFAQFASANGFAMVESCTHTWKYLNGVDATEGYNYTNQYWTDFNGYGDYNKSLWYSSHDIPVLCVAFIDRNDTSLQPNSFASSGRDQWHNGSYEQLEKLWLKAKVLGYEYFYAGTPNFAQVHFDKHYDVGTKLQSKPSNDHDLYWMRYTNGIAYYNETSDTAWFVDGRTMVNMSLNMVLFDDVAHTYNICINNYCGYSITTPGDGWSYDSYSIGFNQTVFDDAFGHYAINISNSDGGYIGDDFDIVTNGLHSFYFNSGWNKFSTANHMVSLTLNDTYYVTIDTTDKIIQTNTTSHNNLRIVNLTSDYHFNTSIITYVNSIEGVFRKLDVWNGSQYINVPNYTNSVACETGSPVFSYNEINGIGRVGFCIDTSTSTIKSKAEFPKLSMKSYSLDADNVPPIVLFNSQTPPDLNLSNFLSYGMNITYNASDDNGLNYTDGAIQLHYKSNSTNSNIMYFQNGTAHEGYFTRDFSYNYSGITYEFNLLDNQILPATYNINEALMERGKHVNATLENQNRYVKINFLNISNTSQYGWFEVMANKTGTNAGDLRIYYCNLTYLSGSPATSSNCVLINTYNGNNYDHRHGENSSHIVIPLIINTTNGTMSNSVKITQNSSFLLRGTNAGTWNYWYVLNYSRTGAMKTSIDGGDTWSTQTYTVDSNVHQYDLNLTVQNSVYYYACFNDTYNNQNCTSPRQDLFELANLPPSDPIITNPTNLTYKSIVIIAYTKSESPNIYDVNYYNITLLNTDYSINNTISANNTNLLTYTWDTSAITDGSYIIMVTACDNISQCSRGYSEEFKTDNTAPRAYIISPSNDTLTSNTSINISIQVNDTDGIINGSLFIYNKTTGAELNRTDTTQDKVSSIILSWLKTLKESIYWFFGIFWDTAGNYNATQNYTFSINEYNSGSGTVASPYIITDCEELQNMRDNLSAYYRLGNDIDCINTTKWNWNGTQYFGFNPIDNFEGQLDGYNHTISSLHINKSNNYTQSIMTYIGIFSRTTDASINNLGLSNLSITGPNELTSPTIIYMGGLIGYANYTNVSSVFVSGELYNGSIVGGLIGIGFNLSISNVYVSMNINMSHSIRGDLGGIIGYDYNSTINNTYFVGNLSGISGALGGIVGSSQENVTYIRNSFSVSRITDSLFGMAGICGYDSYSVCNMTNTYWYDWPGDGATECVDGGDAGGCTKVTNISYFIGDVYPSHNPMARWNFFNIWQERIGDYPSLTWQNLGTSINSAPTILSVILNTTNTNLNDTNQNLTGYATANDTEGDNISFAYNWYRNGILNASSMISDSLVLYYPFNNDTLDYAGDYNATTNGTAKNRTNFVFGGAYEFNGTSANAVDAGTSNNLNFLSNFSLSIWIYPLSMGGGDNARIFERRSISSSQGYMLYMSSNWGVVYDTIGGGTDLVTNSNSITPNRWNHVVAVMNGTNHTSIYINGNLSNTSWTQPITSASGVHMYIGSSSSGTRTFNGTMDEAMIYNRTLNASEISLMYIAGEIGGARINSSRLRVGENWNLGVRAGDFYSWSTETNSSIVQIKPINNPPNITFKPVTTNASTYSQNYININVSASDELNLSNITIFLYLDNTLLHSNTTYPNVASATYNITYSSLSDGTYNINATACDNSSKCNSTATWAIVLYNPSSTTITNNGGTSQPPEDYKKQGLDDTTGWKYCGEQIAKYKTCFYYDGKMCIQGCQSGYYCSAELKCLQIEPTICKEGYVKVGNLCVPSRFETTKDIVIKTKDTIVNAYKKITEKYLKGYYWAIPAFIILISTALYLWLRKPKKNKWMVE